MPAYKEAEKPLPLRTSPGIKFIFPYSFTKYALFQKFFKIKVDKHSIMNQKVSGIVYLSPREGSYEHPKIGIFEISQCTKTAKKSLAQDVRQKNDISERRSKG